MKKNIWIVRELRGFIYEQELGLWITDARRFYALTLKGN